MFDRTAITIDWKRQTVTCPDGKRAARWSTPRTHAPHVVAKFTEARARTQDRRVEVELRPALRVESTISEFVQGHGMRVADRAAALRQASAQDGRLRSSLGVHPTLSERSRQVCGGVRSRPG